jgi:hypothetical protein
MLSLVEMLPEQVLLRGGEDLVDHFVEARERLRISGMVFERLAIELSCAVAGWQ